MMAKKYLIAGCLAVGAVLCISGCQPSSGKASADRQTVAAETAGKTNDKDLDTPMEPTSFDGMWGSFTDEGGSRLICSQGHFYQADYENGGDRMSLTHYLSGTYDEAGQVEITQDLSFEAGEKEGKSLEDCCGSDNLFSAFADQEKLSEPSEGLFRIRNSAEDGSYLTFQNEFGTGMFDSMVE